MRTGKVGVGYNNGLDAFQGGVEAAREAMVSGGIETASLVLAFTSKDNEPEAVFNGIRSVVGKGVPVVGGAASGIITLDDLSYSGNPVGVAIFDKTFLSATVACESDIQHDLVGAGSRLGERLSTAVDQVMFLFFDCLEREATEDKPPSLHPAQFILRGLYSTLSPSIPIYGAGMLGDLRLNSSFIFGGDEVGKQKMVGTTVRGPFTVLGTINHGSMHLDGVYHRITRQQGPVLMELDGRPIVEVIDEAYGSRSWRKEIPVRALSIGINQGLRFAPFEEDAYVNRLIVGPLPDEQGILLFEEGPQEGDDIQFLQRDPLKMMESTRSGSQALLEKILSEGKHPVFALYIDCGGRTAAISLTKTEEASIVQEVMQQAGVLLLGFYSGVEIAPIRGLSRSLDWTGVLIIFAEG
jgi:hypothetical protein